MTDLVSLSTFLSTYIKRTNTQPEDLDEDIVLDFANDAVQKLHSDKTSEHIVDLLPVSNYNTPKPKDCRKFVELAFKNEPFRGRGLMYHDEVISWTGQNFAGCDIKVSVDCPKCHEHKTKCGCPPESVVIKVDEDWLSANVERHYWSIPFYRGTYGLNKMGGIGSFYHPEFSLMRPTSHKFHGADFHVKGCRNLDRRLLADWPIEYKYDPKTRSIRSNVESGTILLSYLAIPKDDDGYPLAPDDVDAFEAIFWDVRAKMLYRDIDKKKNNFTLFKDAMHYAKEYMETAKDKIDAITPAEWYRIMRKYQKGVKFNNSDSQAGRLLRDKFDGAVRRRT